MCRNIGNNHGWHKCRENSTLPLDTPSTMLELQGPVRDTSATRLQKSQTNRTAQIMPVKSYAVCELRGRPSHGRLRTSWKQARPSVHVNIRRVKCWGIYLNISPLLMCREPHRITPDVTHAYATVTPAPLPHARVLCPHHCHMPAPLQRAWAPVRVLCSARKLTMLTRVDEARACRADAPRARVGMRT
jgi:hypothetical protein